MSDLNAVKAAQAVVDAKAGCLFAEELGIDDRKVVFVGESIQVHVPSQRKAKELYTQKRELFVEQCLSWNQQRVDIVWGKKNKLTVFAGCEEDQQPGSKENLQYTRNQLRKLFMQSSPNPIIATPDDIEIGEVSLTPEIQDRLYWMRKNPQEVCGITRVHDERQIIMSASSEKKLLTTTTLKQAVQRRRSEYWHPHDLMKFRYQTWEWVRDLLNGTIVPEQTQTDVSWRCRSSNGSWREITHKYETFVDKNKLIYQLSQNVDIKPIDPPSDIILTAF